MVTVKQNIDHSLEGIYKLKILLMDVNFLIEWPRYLTVNLEKVIVCTPSMTLPLDVKPYYKYFIDGTLEEQGGVTIEYNGFSQGNCKYEGFIQVTC